MMPSESDNSGLQVLDAAVLGGMEASNLAVGFVCHNFKGLIWA
jgi:hypothetical protein